VSYFIHQTAGIKILVLSGSFSIVGFEGFQHFYRLVQLFLTADQICRPI